MERPNLPQKNEECFFRLCRRGNGWVVEKLTIFPTGKFAVVDMGGWDLRDIAEKKLMHWAVDDRTK